jgi:hypothetical protein
MRAVAREEAAAVLGGVSSSDGALDRVSALEAAVTSLHGTILRLEARLDALEKTAGQTDPEQAPARRTRRKTTDE